MSQKSTRPHRPLGNEAMGHCNSFRQCKLMGTKSHTGHHTNVPRWPNCQTATSCNRHIPLTAKRCCTVQGCWPGSNNWCMSQNHRRGGKLFVGGQETKRVDALPTVQRRRTLLADTSLED